MKTSVARQLYRIVPLSLRKRPFANKLSIFVQGYLPHNWVYDEAYYNEAVEGAAVASSHVIAGSVFRDIKPRSVLDVGCGTGAMLAAFRDSGCVVHGLEHSAAALEICQTRQLPVTKFDLERDSMPLSSNFDVVLSMEVAEHLPESVADSYIKLLTSFGRWVVFTAAPPGQGGTDHVNEQLPAYWEAKFRKRGFRLNAPLVQQWKEEWALSGKVTGWYYRNLMVFERDHR